LTLESVDDILFVVSYATPPHRQHKLTQGCDGLSLCVFSVGDSVTNDRFEEGLEDTTSFFVDHGRDTLDTTTASETTDGRLGDTLNVVAQDLAMALGTRMKSASE
jgi:hypothetical protein